MDDNYFPYLFTSPIFHIYYEGGKAVLNLIEKGTMHDLKPIAKKTPNPPPNEEPLTIFWYSTSEKISTHVAAYYRGERMDFYPASVAANDKESTDLSVMADIVVGNSVPNRHLTESTIPDDLKNIQCYNIYPSQLGIDPKTLLNAIKQQKDASQPYNLFTNNCADQIIDIFEKAGLDMSALNDSVVSLPSNVRNFAQVNGYRIDPHDAPFTNDAERVKELLDWVKNPQEMYNKYKQVIAENTGMFHEQANQLNDEMYKSATENPEKLIAEVNKIIKRNPNMTHTAKVAYAMINNMPDEIKNKLQNTTEGNKLLAEATDSATADKNKRLKHTLIAQAKVATNNASYNQQWLPNFIEADNRIAQRLETRKNTQERQTERPILIADNYSR